MDTLGIFWIVLWSTALVVVVLIARHTHTSLLFTTKKQHNYREKNNTDSKSVDDVTKIQERHRNSIIPTTCEESGDKVDYKTNKENPENSLQHNKVSVPEINVAVNHKKLGSRNVNQ